MRSFDVPIDRARIRCAEFGEGEHACLLLHGLGDGLFVWREFAEYLGRQLRVIAPDLRGHGDSDWLRHGEYGFDSYVIDVMALCEHLRLDHPIVIGHSMGGGVALRLARCMQHAVRGLVLVDYGPTIDRPTQRLVDVVTGFFAASQRTYASLEDYVGTLKWEERPLVRESVLRRIASESLRRRTDGSGFELKRDPALLSFFQTQRAAPDAPTLLERLKQTPCPTLVVRGELSGLLSPAATLEMTRALPRGCHAQVPAAAHGVVLDNPQGFIDAVMPFLASTVAALQV
ncbi:alpha/beta hydrolase [Dyella jejuensis]|uniref:Alpha/beta hydrolase n=1 Tax=Dyella jejuensis TaxID=1432009 RepID=A0ABW8JL98_9GAMM